VSSHLLLMLVYAFDVSAFFALLWRREARARWVLFGQIFLSLVGGALVVGWLMYPFPSGPALAFP